MEMGRAVPYATDTAGRVVSPKEAAPGRYFCLECHETVSYRRAHTRRGREVEAHFAHLPGNECAGESVLHLAAKFRLREALELQEKPFVLRRSCSRWYCTQTWDEPLTMPSFDVAAEEVAYGNYRLDVGTLLAGRVVMAFEVFHSHRIGSVKAAGLRVPWVELQAAPTADDPYSFNPSCRNTWWVMMRGHCVTVSLRSRTAWRNLSMHGLVRHPCSIRPRGG